MPRTTTEVDAAAVAAAVTDRDPRPQDEVEAAILAAAVEDALVEGFGNVSLDRVATRAGVARSTLYRRIGDRNALLSAIVADQARRLLDGLAARVAPGPGASTDTGRDVEDRVVAAFAAGLGAARAAGLPEMLRTEPLLLHLVTLQGGPVLAAACERLTAILGAHPTMAARSDLAIVADVLVRLAISAVTVPATAVDWTDEATLGRVLGPLLAGPST